MSQTFLEALRDAPLVADGAMGTQLYNAGVLFTTNYDELCLSRPDLIERIHSDYLKAGAQLIESNTFGANRFRLSKSGFGDKVLEINRKGIELAHSAIKKSAHRAFVAGAIGPTGLNLKQLPQEERDAIRAAFVEQVEGMLSADLPPDCLLIETMRHPEEVQIALSAVRSVTDLPVVVLVSYDTFGTMADGTLPDRMADLLRTWGADAIGVNCGDGPAGVYDNLEKMRGAGLPLVAMPNAGIPRRLDGRFVYMATPEYFGVYAKRLLKLGVRVVGGCCGTTPAHIREMVGSVKMRAAASSAADTDDSHLRAEGGELVPAPGVLVTPIASKSRLANKLGRRFVASVEVNPPPHLSLEKTLAAVKMLQASGVDAINIADGPRASARMSNLAMAVRVEQQLGIETILHVCCRDRNTLGLVSHVLGAHELGLRNLVIITGDPPKMGDYPSCTPVYDMDSVGLLRMVRGLNLGRDPGGKPVGGATSFLLATGAEPAAMDYEGELSKLRRKIQAGAELVMTQPVYEPAVLERFLKDTEGLGVPVLVGLCPLISFRNAEFLHNEVPGMRIPDATRERMRKVGTGEVARREGVRIARELLEQVHHRVAGAYVMPQREYYESAIEVLDGFLDTRAETSAINH
ncbi:MAG: bifunctional homocysteine S-methyltransferase/methylenetetrahydrofolate reductase [Deltaproteobacteria bacterium]|nr:bifunctional homocysteine S-methyltransferase/methylenetetrahydrofolate reductase [Deltaproteobacteria bacterium]